LFWKNGLITEGCSTRPAFWLEDATLRHISSQVATAITYSGESIRLPRTASLDGLGRLKYVLITPARNEAAFLEQAINSVLGQTVLPLKWVIVSDGSTDGTNEILKKYSGQYRWIESIIRPPRAERHFAAKVQAFNAGYQKVQDLEYDVIGSLDADISFNDPDYFAFLLTKFDQDPRLGVAGAPFREGTVQYDYRFSRKEHVSGACQFFRRECFESIGGYVPLKEGAIDLVAVVTARMNGWTTETFPEKFCVHHRQMGTARDGFIRATFKSGYGDYRMGVHPVWQLLRSVYQMSRKPLVLGGALLLSGYLWAMVTRAPKPVSVEFVRFRRKEQKQWLRDYFKKAVSPLGRGRA
jgi:biofilm PGA synthesis N-glycosyltransferase PgaC